jgi:acyl-coenzyme A synthetase/AMP-(fatty) acid ligase
VRGDEVFACLNVDGEPGKALAPDIRLVPGQLAYYKAPGYIAFVDALPLTATQKIQRGVLKALAAELLEDPATIDLRHLKKRSAA